MKKLCALLAFLVLAAAASSQTIAVPAPKTVQLGEGSDWIPLFVQGVITTNLQQYSGLKVIDRQNVDMVKAEQKLSTTGRKSRAERAVQKEMGSPNYFKFTSEFKSGKI